jgi:hypothetical protein
MNRKNPLAKLSTYELLMYALRADPHNPPPPREYCSGCKPVVDADGKFTGIYRSEYTLGAVKRYELWKPGPNGGTIVTQG